MRNFLAEMLYALTSAYTNKDYENAKRGNPPETNIGKLFSLLAWGFGIVDENAERIRSWDNLDNACGTVLDRYGRNFGVDRMGTEDEFYRLAIKVKVMSQLSGGDDDTILSAAAELFDVDLSDIELEDVFPAKVKMTVSGVAIPESRIHLVDQIAAAIKRLLAAGVGFVIQLVYIFKYIIEVSFELESWSYNVPECNTLYCGTYPCYATKGWTEEATITVTLDSELLKYIPRFTGTYPEARTIGEILRAEVQAGSAFERLLYAGIPCGDDLCGLIPSEATTGWTEQTTSAEGRVTVGRTVYQSKLVGTLPEAANVAGTAEAEIQPEPEITEILSVPPFCNTKYCGQS